MNTILYNIIENKVLGFYENGYIVDGKPSETFNNNIVELAVIEIEIPEYNLEMQSITSEWKVDLELKQYRLEWTVTDKTEDEIIFETASKDWVHKGFILRIVAPIELIMDDIGIKMYGWFNLNDLPVVKATPYQVHLYCNELLEEHETVISSLQGVITVEEIPMVLRPVKPYPSWIWGKGVWDPPVPYPEERKWIWDEETLSWVEPPIIEFLEPETVIK